MSSIVTIGGGEIAAAETRATDTQIVDSVTASTPTALFLPTASRDAEGYCDSFLEYYGEKFLVLIWSMLVAGTRDLCLMSGGEMRLCLRYDGLGKRGRCLRGYQPELSVGLGVDLVLPSPLVASTTNQLTE